MSRREDEHEDATCCSILGADSGRKSEVISDALPRDPWIPGAEGRARPNRAIDRCCSFSRVRRHSYGPHPHPHHGPRHVRHRV